MMKETILCLQCQVSLHGVWREIIRLELVSPDCVHSTSNIEIAAFVLFCLFFAIRYIEGECKPINITKAYNQPTACAGTPCTAMNSHAPQPAINTIALM